MLARKEMLRKLHVRDEYYRRRARRSFAEFLRYTKPEYPQRLAPLGGVVP